MSAIWCAASRRRSSGELSGAYQLGYGQPTAIRTLIDTLTQVSGRDVQVRYEPRRSGEVHATWCNIAKAEREFGYRAPTGLEAGLRSTWTWYLENREVWWRQPALAGAD